MNGNASGWFWVTAVAAVGLVVLWWDHYSGGGVQMLAERKMPRFDWRSIRFVVQTEDELRRSSRQAHIVVAAVLSVVLAAGLVGLAFALL